MEQYVLKKTTYTSGEAARVLNIPSRTFRRYLTIGKVEATQNLITQTWTITAEALKTFAEANGLSAVIRLSTLHIYILGVPKLQKIVLNDAGKELDLNIVTHSFDVAEDMLIECGVKPPDIVMINMDHDHFNPQKIIAIIRGNQHTKGVKIIESMKGNNKKNFKAALQSLYEGEG